MLFRAEDEDLKSALLNILISIKKSSPVVLSIVNKSQLQEC